MRPLQFFVERRNVRRLYAVPFCRKLSQRLVQSRQRFLRHLRRRSVGALDNSQQLPITPVELSERRRHGAPTQRSRRPARPLAPCPPRSSTVLAARVLLPVPRNLNSSPRKSVRPVGTATPGPRQTSSPADPFSLRISRSTSALRLPTSRCTPRPTPPHPPARAAYRARSPKSDTRAAPRPASASANPTQTGPSRPWPVKFAAGQSSKGVRSKSFPVPPWSRPVCRRSKNVSPLFHSGPESPASLDRPNPPPGSNQKPRPSADFPRPALPAAAVYPGSRCAGSDRPALAEIGMSWRWPLARSFAAAALC